jgi:hypothetical protein
MGSALAQSQHTFVAFNFPPKQWKIFVACSVISTETVPWSPTQSPCSVHQTERVRSWNLGRQTQVHADRRRTPQALTAECWRRTCDHGSGLKRFPERASFDESLTVNSYAYADIGCFHLALACVRGWHGAVSASKSRNSKSIEEAML